MRKTLLIFSLVIVVAMNVNAQNKGGRYGILIGPTFDWVSSGSAAVNKDDIKLDFGFNAGLVYDYFLSDHIAVSSGVIVNFLQMKYSFVDYRRVEGFLEETNVTVKRRQKATNIEIPVVVKFRFNVQESFVAYLEAGGALDINCKDFGRDDYGFYWSEPQTLDYVDCTNQYRVILPSLIFGLGGEYEINQKLSMFAQLVFHHSLSNAFVGSLEEKTGSILRSNFIGLEVGFIH